MGGKSSHKLTKYSAKQFLRRISAVKTWQFILVLIPLIFITATLFRFDHLRMNDLLDNVLTADANNDDAAIATSLAELQNFVFSHTVFSAVDDNGVQKLVLGTGPFYLQNQYNRAAAAAIEAAENQITNDSNPNGNIYAAASAVCKPIAIQNGWRWNDQGYLDCMTSELAKYPTTDALTSVSAAVPPTDLYRYNYASPLWAPTLAGFLCIFDIILIIIILVRFFIWLFVRIAMFFLRKK
ncbi:hypothetical protein IJ098_03680 [Candidatus Saccharibacteria bacterium]|nr:hypothetical protein [Candidatus Saccharibacteria bacterium]